MGNYSFLHWLFDEMTSARLATLSLLSTRDELLWQKAPKLRSEYMAKIGVHEEEVMKAELDLSMLYRKVELIQAAINRREPIDLEAIDRQIAEERDKRLKSIEDADKTADELPKLTEEEKEELQYKYRKIVECFHPSANHNNTTEQHLYEEALDAYKRQNIHAMRIIYDMLFGVEEEETSEGFALDAIKERLSKEDIKYIAEGIAADYTLAKDLYLCFIPTEDDAVLISATEQFKEDLARLELEIASIQESFPFNAEETLSDPEKVQEYLDELKVRKRNCEKETEEVMAKIGRMIMEASHE